MLVVSLVVLPVVVSGLGEVRELSEASFDGVVSQSNVLVEFYEPDCGHCETMEPEFFAAAESLEFEEDVVFARVDTKENPALKKRFKIDGHPIFKWFAKSTQAQNFYYVHYSGRMANTFLEMVGKRLDKSFPELPPIVSKVIKIKAAAFDETVLELGVDAFVVLYTPWTENKRVAEALDQTAKLYADVRIVKLGVETLYERDIGDRYDCRTYPCYFLFDKLNRRNEFVDGPFDDVNGYVRFLNRNLGTDKDPATLDDRAMAGRIPELDRILPSRDAAALDAVPVSDDQRDTKQYYLKVSKRLEDTASDDASLEYLRAEARRLTALLNKPGISVSKRKDLAVRKNVLGAFAHAIDKLKAKDSSPSNSRHTHRAEL
ncbi:hypothetical protein CTAYLR_003593 [Chrysophaeum taylorii]|uniref:protein disulfide-isomerase n=1 Tax=Chrysophaeum taylorii TaxID=2483200 RepID=A0AAD7XM51_9STRA|nr:hypothetical protein CTAYLR_003593 [Chrysophaeum taylorii]